ncbi:hypothetical protein [Rathayibacter sp. SD072]|nr:hypothetical protein [Rathayibacter sp. SD072]
MLLRDCDALEVAFALVIAHAARGCDHDLTDTGALDLYDEEAA